MERSRVPSDAGHQRPGAASSGSARSLEFQGTFGAEDMPSLKYDMHRRGARLPELLALADPSGILIPTSDVRQLFDDLPVVREVAVLFSDSPRQWIDVWSNAVACFWSKTLTMQQRTFEEMRLREDSPSFATLARLGRLEWYTKSLVPSTDPVDWYRRVDLLSGPGSVRPPHKGQNQFWVFFDFKACWSSLHDSDAAFNETAYADLYEYLFSSESRPLCLADVSPSRDTEHQWQQRDRLRKVLRVLRLAGWHTAFMKFVNATTQYHLMDQDGENARHPCLRRSPPARPDWWTKDARHPVVYGGVFYTLMHNLRQGGLEHEKRGFDKLVAAQSFQQLKRRFTDGEPQQAAASMAGNFKALTTKKESIDTEMCRLFGTLLSSPDGVSLAPRAVLNPVCDAPAALTIGFFEWVNFHLRSMCRDLKKELSSVPSETKGTDGESEQTSINVRMLSRSAGVKAPRHLGGVRDSIIESVRDNGDVQALAASVHEGDWCNAELRKTAVERVIYEGVNDILENDFSDLVPHAKGIPAIQVPILEPLKERVITKSPPKVQIALQEILPTLRALLEVRWCGDVFLFTRGDVAPEKFDDAFKAAAVRVDFIINSGDYKAATDKFKSETSLLIADIISEELEFAPEWAEALRKGLVGFSLSDPDTGESVPQRNGQLMGSPVSFPILNIANALASSYAVFLSHTLESDKDWLQRLNDSLRADGHQTPIQTGPNELRHFCGPTSADWPEGRLQDRVSSTFVLRHLYGDNGIEPLGSFPLYTNGDDVVYAGRPTSVPLWSAITRALGLEESVGKSFVSSGPIRFGCLNSRTFVFEPNGQVFPVPFLSSTALRATEPRVGCNSKSTSVLPTDLHGLQVELIRCQFPGDDSIVGRWSDQVVEWSESGTTPYVCRLICKQFLRCHGRTLDKLGGVPIDYYLPLGMGGLGLWDPEVKFDFLRGAHLEGILLASEDLDEKQVISRTKAVPGFNKLRRVQLCAPATDEVQVAAETMSGTTDLRQRSHWINPMRMIADIVKTLRSDSCDGLAAAYSRAVERIVQLHDRVSAVDQRAKLVDRWQLLDAFYNLVDGLREELLNGLAPDASGHIDVFSSDVGREVSRYFHGTELERLTLGLAFGGCCGMQLVDWETDELSPWYGVVHGITQAVADQILDRDVPPSDDIVLLDKGVVGVESAFDTARPVVDDTYERVRRDRLQVVGSSRAVKQLDRLGGITVDGAPGLERLRALFVSVFGRPLTLRDLLQSAGVLFWWTADNPDWRGRLRSVNDLYVQVRTSSISTKWWL